MKAWQKIGVPWRLQLLALAGFVVIAVGCGRSGPPPYDPNARVFTQEELKACLGNTVGRLKTRSACRVRR